jgi:hypothetical protein
MTDFTRSKKPPPSPRTTVPDMRPLPPPDEDDLALDALSPTDQADAARNKTSVVSIPLRPPTGPEAQRARGVSMASTLLAPLDERDRAILEAEDGTEVGEVVNTVTVIGRTGGVADIMLPGEGVSRQHAALLFSDGSFYLEDLESINGTYVNDRRIKRVKLGPADRFRIGTHVLAVRRRLG